MRFTGRGGGSNTRRRNTQHTAWEMFVCGKQLSCKMFVCKFDMRFRGSSHGTESSFNILGGLMDEWLEEKEEEKNNNTKPTKPNHVMVTGEELSSPHQTMSLMGSSKI